MSCDQVDIVEGDEVEIVMKGHPVDRRVGVVYLIDLSARTCFVKGNIDINPEYAFSVDEVQKTNKSSTLVLASPLAETVSPLQRAYTDGGIPIKYGADMSVIEKKPTKYPRWFGEKTAFRIHDEIYTIDDFLGNGAEGQTYVITETSTEKKFAAKFVEDAGPRGDREVEVLLKMPRSLVHHPNFLRYEMLVRDVRKHLPALRADHIIFMEYVSTIDLHGLIAAQVTEPLSEGTSRRILRDIISGMAECYRGGVTHRDLKPENLLLRQNGTVIIIDFGHSKLYDSSERAETSNTYGTTYYQGPELRNHCNQKYDCELNDIWSLGVIAFLMHRKMYPDYFEGYVNRTTYVPGKRAINIEDSFEQFWKTLANSSYPPFPNALVKFINTLWRFNPEERPTFSQLEGAVAGEPVIKSQFPGLAWLSEPVNEADEFIRELQELCPEKIFKND